MSDSEHDFFNSEGEQDFDDNENVEFKDEVNAFERAGAGKLAELIAGNISFKDAQKKLARENISPEDRFLISADAISRRLKEDGMPITETDIDNILVKATNTQNLKYKNVIAFVLGYFVSSGGREIDKRKLVYIIDNVLPKLNNEGGVMPADIIRYARYWIFN